MVREGFHVGHALAASSAALLLLLPGCAASETPVPTASEGLRYVSVNLHPGWSYVIHYTWVSGWDVGWNWTVPTEQALHWRLLDERADPPVVIREDRAAAGSMEFHVIATAPYSLTWTNPGPGIANLLYVVPPNGETAYLTQHEDPVTCPPRLPC